MVEINSGGMGLLGWLQILFIGLKLTGYITWSWIWVLSPIIASLVLIIFIMIIIFIYVAITD